MTREKHFNKPQPIFRVSNNLYKLQHLPPVTIFPLDRLINYFDVSYYFFFLLFHVSLAACLHNSLFFTRLRSAPYIIRGKTGSFERYTLSLQVLRFTEKSLLLMNG